MSDGDISKNVTFLPENNCANRMLDNTIEHSQQKYPCCIVWTPIPCLTWFFPFIGHMGIATASGIIRDFAGPYHVSTGNMAFGKPTRYFQLDPVNASGGVDGWDKAVYEASEIYKGRMVGYLS